MKSGSYDLHCHSICSDGSKTPKELIDMAKEIDLKGISITDHDTVAAYNTETFDYAKSKGIDLIPGVEFSSRYEKQDGYEPIHILGYGIDYVHKKLLGFCADHKARRKDRFHQIIEKLRLAGYDVTDEVNAIAESESIGRPHVAIALINKGYAVDMESAFKNFLGDRAPFFISSSLPTIEETISVIKIAGGRAILAHPVLIKGRKVLRRVISNYNFDGIECFYGNFRRDRIQFLLDICEHKNLLITGGSDYHGEHRTFVSLGQSFLSDESVRKLLSTSN